MKSILPIKVESQYKGLTSLEATEYELLLEKFDERITKKLKRYTLKGTLRKVAQRREHKSSSLYGSRLKLDFLLIYLKENMNQLTLGHFYQMSQSKVSEWISYLLPVLEESLSALDYDAKYGDHYVHNDQSTTYLAADVTERSVPRKLCRKAQKKDYSGKHKKHTTKNFALCDEYGYIHFLSSSYEGSVHDKSIWGDLNIDTKQINLLMDLGFQGAEKDRLEVILPFKKPRNRELNEGQKQINKALGSLRVIIEHAFAGVKRLKIVRNKIRLRGYEKREQVIKIAVALHNLRVANRKLS